jgi:hypothetical protein
MILERAGYQVIAIDDPVQAMQVFTTWVINAVVLENLFETIAACSRAL